MKNRIFSAASGISRTRSLRSTFVLVFCIVVLLSLSLQPASASTGQWRLLNPTEYTTSPLSNLNGVFLINGGTSGIGSGNGWAVGQNGLIFFWNGFAWYQATPLNTLCTYDSVNFGGPLNPIQNGVQASSGWTVGECSSAAYSLYWNGLNWQSYAVPETATPGEAKSVFLVKSASSTTDYVIAVAVGFDARGGEIWTWNGVPGIVTGWVEIGTSPTLNNLNSVYMTQMYGSTCTGPGVQGVAVGNGGTILTYCGTWTLQSSPVGTTNFNGVAMSSPTSGWAVGASCTIIETTNGVNWAQYSGASPCLNPAVTLRSIVLLSSSEGWAVGDSDANGHPVILHGTSLDSAPSWVQIPVNQVTPTGIASTGAGLNSVTFAPSGGNIWAVGASGVAAFCQSSCSTPYGAIWSTTTSPLTGSGTGHQLNSVFMDSDSDGWAVGTNDANQPALFQWNGYSWTQAPSVLTVVTSPLYGVYMQGSSNAWAVGGTGTSASTLYYNGNTWAGVSAPSCSCSLVSVFMISGSETWAVGTGGVIMHSTTQGGAFVEPSSPVAGTASLDTVFFDSSQSGWAGGACTTVAGNCLWIGDPVIIHTATDGSDGWATVFTPGHGLPTTSHVSYTVTSLFFQDSTHGWATLSSGKTNPTEMLYWNGVSWTLVTPITLLTDDDLFGISVLGGPPATDGWAVGVDSSGKPLTIHYDSSTSAWTETPLTPSIPGSGSLLSVYLRSSTNGLAVGTNVGAQTLALILHLDPPGSFQNTVMQTASDTSTSSTSTPSSSEVSTSAASTESPIASTQSVTTTSSLTTTVVSTSISTSTMTVISTPTTSTSSAISTPMTVPAVPGFPWESIIAGLVLGVAALAIVRRRKK